MIQNRLTKNRLTIPLTPSKEKHTFPSLHDRRFMSQAGWTRYFARSATRGEEKNKAPVRSPLFLLFRPLTRWCQKNQSKHDHMTRHRGQKYLCEFVYNLCEFIHNLFLSNITSFNTFITLLLGLRLSASFTWLLTKYVQLVCQTNHLSIYSHNF